MERLPRGDDDETVQEPPVEAAPEPPPVSDDGMNLMMDMDGSDFFGSPRSSKRDGPPKPSFKVRTSAGRPNVGKRQPSAARPTDGAASRPTRGKPPRAKGQRENELNKRIDGGDNTSSAASPEDTRYDELLTRVSSPPKPASRGPDVRGSANAVDALIVVEGSNDQRAVERAVAPRRGCRILKGSYDAAAGHYDVPDVVIAKLATAANDGARVVVLTDSDVAGRQMRGVVVREVPSALHAFLGTHLSSAKTDTATHKAGNVGVEHASIEDIRTAVAQARPAASAGGSAGVSRREFDRADLEKWGLCGPPVGAPDPKWSAFGGVTERRRLVGEYLGVGDCDAKQLVRQLNLFFTREEADAAIEALPKEGQAMPEKMTDGGADRKGTAVNGDDGEDFDLYTYYPPGVAPPGFE
jgi:5S rRNA maturation endonuclease (ribonuclease M5)